MTEQTDRLTDKQRAWLEKYLACLNATEAARGVYDTEDYATLRRIGCDNLAKPYIRDEVDRRLRAALPSPEAVIGRLAEIAFSDPMQYLTADGTLDVDRLVADERTFLVKGVRPTRAGLAWEFEDRAAALRMLARYHRLVGADVQVDLHDHRDQVTTADLDALTAQLRAALEQEI